MFRFLITLNTHTHTHTHTYTHTHTNTHTHTHTHTHTNRSAAAGKDTCPSCRMKIEAKPVPVKVLDNTIDKVASKILKPDELEERLEKLNEAKQIKDAPGF